MITPQSLSELYSLHRSERAENERREPDRRELLKSGGALALGGVAAALAGSRANAAPRVVGANMPIAALGGPLATQIHACVPALLQAQCNFTPQQIEGPYYLDLNLIRQDITEGKPGIPVYVILQVLRASDCSPLPNAAVDLWQCDALGVYSGVAQQGTSGQTYLRGTQISDSAGLVIFKTVYPGWYHGRTAHLHFKVHPTATTEFTSQLYYPQFVTDYIYANFAPYTQKGPANTKNAQDMFFSAQLVQPWIPNPDGSLGIWSGMILGVTGV